MGEHLIKQDNKMPHLLFIYEWKLEPYEIIGRIFIDDLGKYKPAKFCLYIIFNCNMFSLGNNNNFVNIKPTYDVFCIIYVTIHAGKKPINKYYEVVLAKISKVSGIYKDK